MLTMRHSLYAVRHGLGIDIDRAMIITKRGLDNKITVIITAEIIRWIAIIIGLYSDQEAITVFESHLLCLLHGRVTRRSALFFYWSAQNPGSFHLQDQYR